MRPNIKDSKKLFIYIYNSLVNSSFNKNFLKQFIQNKFTITLIQFQLLLKIFNKPINLKFNEYFPHLIYLYNR
jgi:hypothetical protein